MSSFIQKIRKARTQHNTFHFSPAHLQTSEFMQNNVVFCDYVVPTDHFKIRPLFEGRCASLKNPSFINTEYHVRAFYVPHSIVWKRFDDWVNGNMTLINGVHYQTNVPTVSDLGLTNLLKTYTSSDSPVTITNDDLSTDLSHRFDFVLTADNVSVGYKLNNEGRFIYKLLRSLGYKINFVADSTKSDYMNALALLSYFRVYVDYFVPSTFYESSACLALLSRCYNPTEDLDVTSLLVLLKNAFDEVYQNFYPSDYITASWQQPQSPRGSNLQNIYSQNGAISEFSDILRETSTASTSRFENTSTSGIQSSHASVTNNNLETSNYVMGNPWVQRNLQKLADWLTRTRFVGTDKLSNLLARFGVRPDNELNLRSKFCGSFTQPLVVQDINSMSDTYTDNGDGTSSGARLGQYAGKMFTQVSSNKTFDIKCDDYGCIIITSMITPRDIRYYEGMSRNIMKVKPLEFYQPEFDSMGTQLQSRRELISGLYLDLGNFIESGISNWQKNNSNGYVPRYSEYKTEISNVSGDFAVPSLNATYNSYHHFRSLFKYGRYISGGTTKHNVLVPNTGEIDDVNNVSLGSTPTLLSAQSNLLCRAEDKNQFNRIFNVTSNEQDHIYTMYYFEIIASRPMGTIADSIDVEDGSNDKVDISKDVVENFK